MKYTLDDNGSDLLYRDEQVKDGGSPTDDNGSSGLTSAKCLQEAGMILNYDHTFSTDEALKILSIKPISVGASWFQGMSNPKDGVIHITGDLLGGHQFCIDECVLEEKMIWGLNSWGKAWGKEGRFGMSFQDSDLLLKMQGDVTIFNSLQLNTLQ